MNGHLACWFVPVVHPQMDGFELHPSGSTGPQMDDRPDKHLRFPVPRLYYFYCLYQFSWFHKDQFELYVTMPMRRLCTSTLHLR
jgi:hypothetical protein